MPLSTKVQVRDEGTFQGAVKILDFVGAGVSAAVTGAVATVTISGGAGTVTSVAQSFTGGLISVSGSPITGAGTLALTVAGTSGGIPYFSGATTWASSGALTASAIVLGGGAGAAPTVLGSLGSTTTLLHGNAAGAPTFGAVVEGDLSLTDITTANVSATAHGFAPKFPNNTTTFLRGDGTYAAPSGGASLDGITAAAADQAGIANADWNVRWNWAKVTDSEVAFRLSESAAATGGTSTSDVPNQVLFQLDTLAASTMSPLKVLSRGSHVFSVSPTTAQTFFAGGTVLVPTIAFAGTPTTGISSPAANQIAIGAGGTQGIRVRSIGAGEVSLVMFGADTGVPAALITNSSTGITGPIGGMHASAINWRHTAGNNLYSVGIENTATDGTERGLLLLKLAVESSNQYFLDCSFGTSRRFSITTDGDMRLLGSAGASIFTRSSADATSFAISARKSRGTIASPTVITTGDDLLTLSGYGYVGATNTYQEAARITFDSTGTISDSATGIGGIIRFLTANVGAEPVEAMAVRAAGDVTLGLPSPATTVAVGFPQIPTMAGTPTGVPTVTTGFNPMVYDTTGRKLWIYDYGGTPAWIGVVVA